MEKFSESLDHINAKKKSRQVYCGKIYSFCDMISCVCNMHMYKKKYVNQP